MSKVEAGAGLEGIANATWTGKRPQRRVIRVDVTGGGALPGQTQSPKGKLILELLWKLLRLSGLSSASPIPILLQALDVVPRPTGVVGVLHTAGRSLAIPRQLRQLKLRIVESHRLVVASQENTQHDRRHQQHNAQGNVGPPRWAS